MTKGSQGGKKGKPQEGYFLGFLKLQELFSYTFKILEELQVSSIHSHTSQVVSSVTQ